MSTAARKTGQVRIPLRAIDSISPSPENETLYRPVDPKDPEVWELAKSIRQHGVQEPLVVTRDGWILSGHRRHVAARLAGLTKVPCRVHPIRREDDHDKFVELLREFNRQRIKSLDEKLREEIVSADPQEAYDSLIEHRREQSAVSAETITIRGEKRRRAISKGKWPFLESAMEVIQELRPFWPTTVREVHYGVLNDPPLRHASKPKSRYVNDDPSYSDLTDLLARARLEGHVPWEAITDETRPMVTWDVSMDVQPFLRNEVDGFLKNYWRNLVQSQPNHTEIVGEKNTQQSLVRPVAMEFTIPYTLGRGYCCLDRRYKMAQRFKESGKDRLVLLFLSDFDPDGEEIAHSFARSMRDDFGIEKIEPIKVAITADQVREHRLPPKMKAKGGAATYDQFVELHGKHVFELEALPAAIRQQLLRDAIDSVLDVKAFNHELDREREDAAFLQGIRRTVHGVLRDVVQDGSTAE